MHMMEGVYVFFTSVSDASVRIGGGEEGVRRDPTLIRLFTIVSLALDNSV